MDNKIAFIICTNDKLYCSECLYYISRLHIPKDYSIETIIIENAEYITKAYNNAMIKSDAKYKVYLHQDSFILNENFIYDILDIFKNDKVGMIGIAGRSNILDFINDLCWDSGAIYDTHLEDHYEYIFYNSKDEYSYVEAVDGLCIITQYDIKWRDDVFCGWDFYDISQSIEFLKHGYKIVVPNPKKPWVLHDCGKLNLEKYLYWKKIFLQEYADFIYDKRFSVNVNNDILNTNNNDLLKARTNIVKKFKDNVDVTIGIVAYNRLDITKLCIQSVLDNTKDIKYKLVLVYNENEQGEGILEYFNAIDYKDKVVIHIKENVGAPFAYQHINKYIEGKYFVHLPNDVIVTPNWLLNLIKCAESDHRIGMVNPVSSNVSNLQYISLSFNSYDEMQKKAADYNISNPLKWQERIRLITLGTLFTRECLSAIGPVFDIGFMHDFGDDDVSFRVRRAGYKAVLACDTWVHHAHDVFHMENKNPEEYQKSLKEGRENFNQKYYGIDPWDDVNNYIFPYIEKNITPPADKNSVKVLGIDVKCGTPILDIKNCLRTFNVIDPKLHAFTSDAKYYIDLKTICDDVVCDRHEYLINFFKETKFDYIIIGDSINSYKEPEQTIECAYSLLNNGGQLFISLKNTYNAITMLKMLGHSVDSDENILQIEFNSFYNSLKKRNMKIELINCQLYDLSDEIIDYCSNLIRYSKSNDCKEEDLLNQLRVDNYWIKIMK